MLTPRDLGMVPLAATGSVLLGLIFGYGVGTLLAFTPVALALWITLPMSAAVTGYYWMNEQRDTRWQRLLFYAVYVALFLWSASGSPGFHLAEAMVLDFVIGVLMKVRSKRLEE